ncbi:conserved hypothetical protein [Cryptococcus deneoformans JEC21]|uniref:Ima1 N-terminal domain-containing protein n=1 Tax=Cryptococcus deneoformans (strain JEC21 / ATCC MYA-565) TaxID=214684 RepID=Q5KNI5_CRYD1|nr:conserved hypothetical protein [Cryptococcus neoformans var. neoformans JEC21]AAW41163.1 conserved hypothetical protein [Cryptococcus neoformans var. neoformans JEC21]
MILSSLHMPFLRPSARPQPVQCFFCLSPALLPPRAHVPPPASPGRKGKERIAEPGTKWNWQCERCGCWNIRDAAGEMMSDLPAMHNSTFNSKSFALRAQPSSSHLPTASSSTSPFCRNCLTNQTLVMNLLANYLPDEDDPSYPTLYANFSDYLSSLHARYPPVCSSCQPAVDDALRRSDHRAQMEAWGSALTRGKQIAKGDPEVAVPELGRRYWRMKCALWILTWVSGLSQQTMCWNWYMNGGEADIKEFIPSSLIVTSTSCNLAMLLWVLFDLWPEQARNEAEKKHAFKTFPMIVSLSTRLVAFCCLLCATRHNSNEHVRSIPLVIGWTLLTVETLSFFILFYYAQGPGPVVPIKLVRPVPVTHSPQTDLTTQNASQLDGLHSLSSHTQHPQALSPNPVFGQPSLQRPVEEPEPEPMDWEPSPIVSKTGVSRPPGWTAVDDEDDTASHPKKADWDSFAINKQRMFPRAGQEETGLENLLAGWGLDNGLEGAPRVQTVRNDAILKKKYMGLDKAAQMVLFALFMIRLFGAAGFNALSSSAHFAIFSRANIFLLSSELSLTIVRLLLIFTTQPVSFLNLGLAIFDAVLRGMVLTSHDFVDVLLDQLGDERIRCVEWVFWGFLDLVGLSM